MPASYSPFASQASDRIDTIGEVGLLRLIRGWLAEASPASPAGIGDDCAVAEMPPHGQAPDDKATPADAASAAPKWLFTTDAVVYQRHFDQTCPPELAAEKLLKRNLSDIAAMGGTPHSALLALTLAPQQSLHWLEQFFRGLRVCSLRYNTPITGGDITAGTDHFFAAHLTLIGHGTRPLLRSGAKAGDHIFVTGALGGSIHGHHLHFEPRLTEGRWLASRQEVRSMIDLTDGLAKDLPELLPADCVALLNTEELPISKAAAMQQAGTSTHHSDSSNDTPQGAEPVLLHALADGEDYELLFTVSGETDPQTFVAAWHAHFGTDELPSLGSPTAPQVAYPYHIGTIAEAAAMRQQSAKSSDTAQAPLLYDATSGRPLHARGFTHLL